MPKESFSFYRYLVTQNDKGKKYKDDDERKWHEMYSEVGAMNSILTMNLVMMKEKLRPFTNQGFNYKDRKVQRGGKLWVKENE